MVLGSKKKKKKVKKTKKQRLHRLSRNYGCQKRLEEKETIL